MALRHFKDQQGNEWRVWDVVPFGGGPGERRALDRRTEMSDGYSGPERRAGRDRRLRTPALMTPGLEGGWLCFEHPADKRRLSPIPAGWDEAPADELAGLLDQARSVSKRHD